MRKYRSDKLSGNKIFVSLFIAVVIIAILIVIDKVFKSQNTVNIISSYNYASFFFTIATTTLVLSFTIMIFLVAFLNKQFFISGKTLDSDVQIFFNYNIKMIYSVFIVIFYIVDLVYFVAGGYISSCDMSIIIITLSCIFIIIITFMFFSKNTYYAKMLFNNLIISMITIFYLRISNYLYISKINKQEITDVTGKKKISNGDGKEILSIINNTIIEFNKKYNNKLENKVNILNNFLIEYDELIRLNKPIESETDFILYFLNDFIYYLPFFTEIYYLNKICEFFWNACDELFQKEQYYYFFELITSFLNVLLIIHKIKDRKVRKNNLKDIFLCASKDINVKSASRFNKYPKRNDKYKYYKESYLKVSKLIDEISKQYE